MVPKRWVVFKDIDGKWDAVHSKVDSADDYVQEIADRGGMVKSFVNFQTKDEAINYTMDCLREYSK